MYTEGASYGRWCVYWCIGQLQRTATSVSISTHHQHCSPHHSFPSPPLPLTPPPAVAKLLLQRGANINTHSAEFKESALTLACYKGHLEMVRFLLEAGADQEHKTDEMHTALMEASMVGMVGWDL